MSALGRKLRRDLWSLRGQVLTIALVVGCGIAAYVTGMTCHDSLVASRQAFYATARFADLFATAERVPDPMLARIAALPGVAAAQATVAGDFRVEVEGFPEPVRGRFISLDRGGDEVLNALVMRAGRPPEPLSSDEVVLSEMFAEAQHLAPGDSFTAILDGRRTRLRVVGVALSPEYVWAIAPGGIGMDNQRFGIVWMNRRPLAAALGLQGAFNSVAVRLAPGGSLEVVRPALDRLLAPYGGLGSHGRDLQPSHRMVSQELGQLRGMALVLPPIFLGVAAFLLNLILSRIVGAQREQIATLKALGYRSRDLALHFMELTLAICAVGAGLGLALGATGGRWYTRLYEGYFRFPTMEYRFDARSALVAALITAAAGLVGAVFAVKRVVELAPAEAMRPEAPPSFEPTWIEHLGLHRLFPASFRMVLRDLERRPIRAVLSVVAVALATGIVVAGGSAFESMDRLLKVQFDRIQREDVTVGFARTLPRRAVRELAHVPGVRLAEAQRAVPVRLRAGHRERETVVLGVPRGGTLRQLLDRRFEPLQLPRQGLVLSRPLAESLRVQPGDELEVEVLQGERPTLKLRVGRLADDLLGLSGYMDLEALGAALREPDRAEGALLSVEPGQLDAVVHRLGDLPAIASISRPSQERAAFTTQMARTFLMSQLLLTAFAAAIAVGVVYNNARIALAVRSRDLATLRILGFTRGEVANVLAGEQVIHLGFGIPLGMPLGAWLARLTERAVDPELFRIPMEVGSRTFLLAASVVLLAALGSGLLVRRRTFRLDLVSVLKARD